MNKYTIYCTPEQTKKALELGAPIEVNVNLYGENRLHIPTAEQMIEWLEETGMLIHVYHEIDWLFSINHFEGVGRFNSRKEATLAAIDAALEHFAYEKTQL